MTERILSGAELAKGVKQNGVKQMGAKQ
jgi:hypothetical protein